MTRFKWGKAMKMLIAALMVCLLSVLSFAVYNTYDAYTQMMIAQQQQHLLITARAASQNLSLYLSEQIRNVEILTQTPGFLNQFHTYYVSGEQKGLKEHILSYMLSQNQGISRIYLLDQNGNEVFRYNQYPFLEAFDESVLHLDRLVEDRQTGLGSAFRISPQHYGLTLVNSITDGNDYLGAVVSVLDMEALYQQYMVPLQLQGTVDLIVKNERGTIIMHPESEMLAFNYFGDIPDLDTLPEYESLWNMLQLQYSQEEGVAIYRSYSSGILPEREEISAFSRMNLNGTSWYISAVMPYSQVVQMVNENLNRFAFLVTVIFILIASSILIIYGLQKNRQKLKIEARYLRDMNRTLEELHESREQVRHYQKLQTIGALAGGIVHEFNNLLTPIMGYSEFLKHQLGPENEYYEDIDEIYKAGSRAKEIVDPLQPAGDRFFPVQCGQPQRRHLGCPENGADAAHLQCPAGGKALQRPHQCLRQRHSDPSDTAEPMHQCVPSHGACGGNAHRRHPADLPGSAAAAVPPRVRRRICSDRGIGYWLWDSFRDALPDFRPIFHHQGGGRRYGVRPVCSTKHFDQPRRLHRGEKHIGPG